MQKLGELESHESKPEHQSVMQSFVLRGETYLVCSRQSSPGLVCSSVIVLSFGHFDIVAEADEDLSFA